MSALGIILGSLMGTLRDRRLTHLPRLHDQQVGGLGCGHQQTASLKYVSHQRTEVSPAPFFEVGTPVALSKFLPLHDPQLPPSPSLPPSSAVFLPSLTHPSMLDGFLSSQGRGRYYHPHLKVKKLKYRELGSDLSLQSQAGSRDP